MLVVFAAGTAAVILNIHLIFRIVLLVDDLDAAQVSLDGVKHRLRYRERMSRADAGGSGRTTGKNKGEMLVQECLLVGVLALGLGLDGASDEGRLRKGTADVPAIAGRSNLDTLKDCMVVPPEVVLVLVPPLMVPIQEVAQCIRNGRSKLRTAVRTALPGLIPVSVLERALLQQVGTAGSKQSNPG